MQYQTIKNIMIMNEQVYFIPFIKENINEAYNYINHENGFIYDYVIEMFESYLSNFIEDNLNTYYNNKMDISYFVNENKYNSIFNLDIMNNGIYLSHSLEG